MNFGQEQEDHPPDGTQVSISHIHRMGNATAQRSYEIILQGPEIHGERFTHRSARGEAFHGESDLTAIRTSEGMDTMP